MGQKWWDSYSTITTSYNKGMAKGRAEGIAEGRAEGIAEGRAKGIAEGRAEGLIEGETRKNLENARKMKVLGIDTKVIGEITGLTAEEIETL